MRVDPEGVPEPPPIERAFFRDAEDGTTVFFPWGLGHRGHRLTEAGARAKASRAASLLIGSTVAIGTWTAYRLQPLVESGEAGPAEILRILAECGGAMALVLLAYALWVARFVERFPESGLRISREERMREAAALAGPGKVAGIGVVTCGLGALLFWIEPSAWWLGAAAIALGVGLVGWSGALRRAAARAPEPRLEERP